MKHYIDYKPYIMSKLNPKDKTVNFCQKVINTLDKGKVKSVFTEGGTSFVTIQYDVKDQKHNIIQPYAQTLVIDRKTIIKDSHGRKKSVKDIKENTVLNAKVSSQETRSLPPQSKAFRIDIISS